MNINWFERSLLLASKNPINVDARIVGRNISKEIISNPGIKYITIGRENPDIFTILQKYKVYRVSAYVNIAPGNEIKVDGDFVKGWIVLTIESPPLQGDIYEQLIMEIRNSMEHEFKHEIQREREGAIPSYTDPRRQWREYLTDKYEIDARVLELMTRAKSKKVLIDTMLDSDLRKIISSFIPPDLNNYQDEFNKMFQDLKVKYMASINKTYKDRVVYEKK